jgi:ferrochelatase
MRGILLINLGTPDSPSVRDVRSYLKEFLSDPYVIDIPSIARWLLLNLIILPTRPKKSAHAYQSIWTQAGSPLLVNSELLAKNAQETLGENYQVALGMRYKKPSIKSAIDQLKNCDELIILPLFPQYSLAATETAIQAALKIAEKIWPLDKIKVIKDFYNQPAFIKIQAELIKTSLQQHKVEKLILSYHGLPERQVNKSCEYQLQCGYPNACAAINSKNANCYRAQCFATSQAIINELALNNDFCLTTFQSRLGRTPWIKPYTDDFLMELAKQGVKNIAIACPSFICDCLETLEEIGIRAKEQWQQLGGESLILIPCINNNANWIKSLIY